MKEMICRLCLQTIGSNNYCQPVEEFLLRSLKLNINISKENVMCIECANCLQIFSNFTPGCVYMEVGKDGIKLEPEPTETTSNPKSLIKTEAKCSFCTKTRGIEDLVSLKESKENMFLVNLLEEYISEMNLKNTEELLTCETCLESLEGVSSVILKCQEVEEKISKYVELEGTDDKGQVELKKVQQFMFKPILKSEIESIGVNELKDSSEQVHEEYTMMAEAEIKYEREISNTELIIKSEDDDIKLDQSDINSEEGDCDGFQELLIDNKSPSEIEMFKCEMCPYSARKRSRLNRHRLIHKSPSEIKMFKCAYCSFETKYKYHIKNHLLTHKSLSEVKTFKCEMCPYSTRNKSHLKRHQLIHKSSSEINMFKCQLCPYEAKHKYLIDRHLLTHKSLSEVKTFKCEMCPYEAKLKTYLTLHLLTHRSPSEIKMFKCDLCPYEAKHKKRINIHLLTHKSLSEVKTFKCEMCPYVAKLKPYLTQHLLIHKSHSETKMFKCEMCSYATIIKSRLRRHQLMHKSPSEVKMFKCELCPYETKYKYRINVHLLTHKSLSEVKTFKCEMCPYEAKHKTCLTQHVSTHKYPSETKMCKCDNAKETPQKASKSVRDQDV